MLIRQATVADLDTILRHRRGMFREMELSSESRLDAMVATSVPFIRAGLEDGTWHSWLVETEAGVVAGGSVMIVGHPSSPGNLQPRRAWILNVFTEPEHRGRGLARALMQTMVDWCRAQGFGWVLLHASDAGRPLYESMGFKASNEMRLKLT